MCQSLVAKTTRNNCNEYNCSVDMLKVWLSKLTLCCYVCRKVFPMPKLDSARQCQLDGFRLRRVVMGEQGSSGRYISFHLDHIASSYAYSIQLICAYWWITVPAYMQVDTVRDNVQMALHAISSGNAEKVPIEQRKDLKRRNLINNVWVVQFCLLDLQYHQHAWCAHCAHMQMNHHSWWKVM